MLKENYLTQENEQHKTSLWQQELSIYKKRWKPFTLQNTALLVIDMQNYFLDESSHAFVPSGEVALKNTLQLIEFFRKQEKPIVFTHFAIQPKEDDPIGNWWKDTVEDGSHQSKIFPKIQPQENESIIRKNTYDSFYNTQLEEILRRKGVKNIVITGLLTNLCCETTARQAFVRNFDVFFTLDATATYNEQMHMGSLRNLSYGFVTPVSTEEVLNHSM